MHIINSACLCAKDLPECFYFREGLGYADVENRVVCKPETIMRIASISKCLTMMAVAKLWEEGKLDLDAPVQKYVPEFPEKVYEGEKVCNCLLVRGFFFFNFCSCHYIAICVYVPDLELFLQNTQNHLDKY